MLPYHRAVLPSTLLCRRFSLCHCLLGRKSKGQNKKESSTTTAFPPHFEQKIRNWERLINHELKARIEQIKLKQPYSILPNLKLIDIKRNVRGDVAFMKISKSNELTKIERDKIYRTVCMMRSGIPVTLQCDTSEAEEPVENEENTPSTSSVSTGVFLGVREEDDDSIMIKLIDGPPLKGDQDITYRMCYEEGYGFYRRLQELFDERKHWSKFPGYKLLLYTYRARSLPVAYSDRRITLPSEYNQEQCDAISAAINSKRPITAVLGPPGTGKTKVIGQIITECIRDRKKVLVCAPSHKALENIMMVCKRRGLEKYCKLHGDDNKGRYLETLIKDHSYFPMLDGYYNELNTIVNDGTFDSSPDGAKILKNLRGRISSLERQIRIDIASTTQIFMCTLSAAGMMNIIELGFTPDLTIIDEAGQAMEVETWPMLFQAPRAVIFGDHKQLSPLLLSEKARTEGLNISLIETLANEHSSSLLFKLRVQHRSNYLIQDWSNHEFYNGELKAHPACANIHLRDLIKSNNDAGIIVNEDRLAPLIDDPLVLVDTDLDESDPNLPYIYRERFFNHSYYNVGEAIICAAHLQRLIEDAKIDPSLIGCIAPYTHQVREIKKRLPKELGNQVDISSVDAFQGQEREVIIMSFVRNNNYSQIGFLEDTKRMNVALTRAKRQFFIVASGRMMQINEAIGRLYQTICKKGRIIRPSDILSRERQTVRQKKSHVATR